MKDDDIVAPFSLDNGPVRGRMARLGPMALDPILRRHDYPRCVAMLLGEALTLAALVQSLLKVDGRLIVQAQGQGLVPLLVAEASEGGALRGYARLAQGAAQTLARQHRVAPGDLLGAGNLVMTLERGGDQPAYQGVVPLEGATLGQCAESFFRVSEQTDTRIALAVGEVVGGQAPLWRAGGILMQRLASDAVRGDTGEDWSRASMLFATVTDAELIDPALAADRLLYRLFHEESVRMGDGASMRDLCTCDEERLTNVMKQFPADELRALVEPDGKLHARCQFCSREYLIAPERVVAD